MKPATILLGLERIWFRVTRRVNRTLAPVAFAFAGKGRFDVGGALLERPSSYLSDVVYVSNSELASLHEAIATFRGLEPSPDQRHARGEQSLSDILSGGIVPLAFLDMHNVAGIGLARDYEFVDLEAAETISYLNSIRELRSRACQLGHAHIDRCLLISGEREFTQAISAHFYAQYDAAGRPRYSGIIYGSRFGSRWSCLAIFASRVELILIYKEPLTKDRYSFKKALQYMNLALEEVEDPGILQASFLLQLPTLLELQKANKRRSRKSAQG